jgi:hypothetical protein
MRRYEDSVSCERRRLVTPYSISPAQSALRSAVDPLFAFAFLQTFIDILREYFGALSAATLKDNFDVVYQVRGHLILSLFGRLEYLMCWCSYLKKH